MAKDLNGIYSYKIKRAAKYDANLLAVLKANPIKSEKDWKKSCYQSIKDFIKGEYYLPQNRRCAYCRKKLNTDAYFNHIEHIIPKSQHKRWMFTPKNLTISCEVCNPLKNAEDTLRPGHSKTKFPKRKTGFIMFNPHFEKWEDCFEIEEGMFIKGKNKRGEEAIRICRLYQYQFSVQFSEESEVKSKSAIKRATTRLIKFPKNSIEYLSAQKVIAYYSYLI
jgi:hypothetical protein